MKLLRDVSGTKLQSALRRVGYETVRQRGSHVRITTQGNREHHDDPAAQFHQGQDATKIWKSVAQHHETTVEELLHELDL